MDKVEVHFIPGMGFSSNIFVVEDCGDCIMVDAGLHETSDYVLSNLRKMLGERKPDRIILTHRHCDHIGGAPILSASTGARILAPEGEVNAIKHADATTGASMFGVRVEAVEVESMPVGSILSVGDVDFEILHTPGHTSGSCVLYSKAEKLLISGDTVFSHGGVGRWDLPTGDHYSLVKSLDMLCQLDVELLCPGHGPALEEGGAESILASRRGMGMWG